MVDLARGNVDVAVRYLADATAFRNAVFLFGERLMPVASPALVEARAAAHASGRSRRATCSSTTTIPQGLVPWLNWQAWLAANGAPDLKPAGAMRFSLYDQVIQAAIAGQGVALGRIPLITRLLDARDLVAPFGKRYDSPRGYYAIAAPHATQRPEVIAFVEWLRTEAHEVTSRKRKATR